MATKGGFLQVRVSRAEKRQLERAARAAGASLSAYLLSRALPPADGGFVRACERLRDAAEPQLVFATLHDILAALPGEAISALGAPSLDVATFEAAYVAAMVEVAAACAKAPPPTWCRSVPPQPRPWFASSLGTLRAHLLVSSPPPFRARNLFVDATVGARV